MAKRAKRKRKNKRTGIKVKQKDDYNRYHHEYTKLKKKHDPLPMGKLFTNKDKDPWRL